MRTDLDTLKKSHPLYDSDDPILTEVTTLFDKKTGAAFSNEQLTEVYKEGESRYQNEIPPGYKDRQSKKDGPKQKLYGDLILWKQIIKKALTEKKPVILVTDDLKDDWWDKFNGQTQGPRKELLREFFEQTEQKIYIYQADKFLEYANKLKIGRAVKGGTIKEVRDVRIRDEQSIEAASRLRETVLDYIHKMNFTKELKDRLTIALSQPVNAKFQAGFVPDESILAMLAEQGIKEKFALPYEALFEMLAEQGLKEKFEARFVPYESAKAMRAEQELTEKQLGYRSRTIKPSPERIKEELNEEGSSAPDKSAEDEVKA